MSLGHSIDIDIRSGDTVADEASADGLREATNGDLHLFVTFNLEGVRHHDTDNTPTNGHHDTANVTENGHHDTTNAPANGHQNPPREPTGPDVSVFDAGPTDVDAVGTDPHPSLCTAVGTSSFNETADIESLVSYLELDFFEHELFAREILPDEDEIRYTNRGIGDYQLLCVYDADRGILVVVDKAEPIRPIVDSARSMLTET